jgi:hypothetical protein
MNARLRPWRSMYVQQVKALSTFPGRTIEPATTTRRKEEPVERAPARRLTLVKR